MSRLANIYRLGVKELWSLARDPMMMGLIVYAFTAMVYISATAMPEALHHAPIAIADEDTSPLSARIASSFQRPSFMSPAMISAADVGATPEMMAQDWARASIRHSSFSLEPNGVPSS